MLIPRELTFARIPDNVNVEVFIGKSGITSKLRGANGPVVISSFKDLGLTDQSGRPVIFMEHGAGQGYSNAHTSYVGGVGRARASAILSPGKYAQDKNSAAYPRKLCLAPGCPRVDELRKIPRQDDKIAFSFHWDCTVAPESRSAFPFYKSAIVEIAKKFPVIVHSHPRISGVVKAFCDQFGLQWVEEFEDVVRMAELYICDNSSTIFEWAAIARPVILLNCPHYRKFMNHGLRFWDFSKFARSVDGPGELENAIKEVLGNKDQIVERQAGFISENVYNNLGSATEKVVEIIRMPEFYKKAVGTMANNTPDKVPSIMMRGLKRFEEAEGGIYEGMPFHPGWAHKAFLVGPRRHDIQLIPIAPIPGINEENRASQFEQRGLAERIPMPEEIQMITPPSSGVYLQTKSSVVTVRSRLSPQSYVRGAANPPAPKAEIKTVKTKVVEPDTKIGVENEEETNITVVDHPENQKEAPPPQDDKMADGASTNKMAKTPETTKTHKKRNPKGVRYSS